MQFWEGGAIANLLFLGCFLLLAVGVRKLLPIVDRWAVPDSVIGGTLGFLLGPSIFGLLPIDQRLMETLAYHGLAIAFVAVGLQEPNRQKKAGGARSFIFGIPALALVQGIAGLLFVLAWSATVTQLHPGFGLMLPLGFSQGPGQALSLGAAWQPLGFEDGGQIGLIMAALGFVWCCLLGVPLVGLARRRGWLAPPPAAEEGAASAERAGPGLPPPGGQEPLAMAIGAIAAVYLCAYGVLLALNSALSAMPKQQSLIWGFHFIVASVLAISSRKIVKGLGSKKLLNDNLLARVAGLVVDFTTVAALSAIELKVLQTYLVPILVVTVIGGTLTLVGSLWLARRAFPEAPFEHALVLFGTSTGTLPTGLTLLRILDPELRGPVASNVVIGASAAVLPGAPLLIVIMPYAINRWPEGFPGAVWADLGMMIGYLALLVVMWRFLGPLRFPAPFASLWPKRDDDG